MLSKDPRERYREIEALQIKASPWHKGCSVGDSKGGEGRLRFIARVGVDPHYAIEVAAMKCEACKEVVTSMEWKKIEYRFRVERQNQE